MPSLTTATVVAQMTYAFSKTITGIGPVKTDTLTTGVKSALSVPTVANTGIAEVLTLAASASSTIDLSAFTDPFGDAGSATKVLGILLLPAAGGGDAVLSPGATNPATWFFGGTTPTHTVKAGGAFLHFEPAGTTIDATHKTLTLTNASGTLACTCTVVVLMKQ